MWTDVHLVDLHMHTTHSDGRLAPTALIDLVASSGIRIAAVTDHDSTEGLHEAQEAAGRHEGFTLIHGIELSADLPGTEVHVLGYHIDKEDPAFQETLAGFREGRLDRGQRIVQKLAAIGLPLSWERVLDIANGAAVGRPHVAQALIEKGYVQSNQEAFDKYLAKGRAAYAERDKLTPEGAVDLILRNGGVPVLAHPTYVKGVEEMLPSLVEAGLKGMEVHYGRYTEAKIEELRALAERYGLIPCGGSDYHGVGYDEEAMPGAAGPPVSTVERLAEAHQARLAFMGR